MLALKIMNLFDKGKRDQLVREINALYDADCPCLVKFYGAFYRESAITIALEFMDGGSLETTLPLTKYIPERALAAVTFQVLYGLATLHSGKRVHRDIKPSNLLINSAGEVKITDFGISAELTQSINMCRTFVGTFKYMSPERVRSQGYGYQSDLWSLGLVVMECATGRYPLPEEETVIGMVQTIINSEVPKLSRDRFPELMCHFVELCLDKDPSKRLNATVLMGHPWFARQHIADVAGAVAVTADWLASQEWEARLDDRPAGSASSGGGSGSSGGGGGRSGDLGLK
ncbi:unnamed protein product [Phaeothamnion confervicola]